MNIFVLSAMIIWAYMSLLYLLALWRKDNSLADIGWGLGFVLVFWGLWWFSGHQLGWTQQLVMGLLVTFWGIRLVVHIGLRHWGKPEDFRYQQWRKEWGKHTWWRSYLQVFLLQGFFLFVISIPFVLSVRAEPLPMTFLGYLAAIIWLIGFFFEAVGDWQLQRFKADPKHKGKLMTSGLWIYTRHPNYFGEACLWWGIFLLAVQAPWGWVAIVSPLVIAYLLIYVSGIPLLEEKYKGNPAFEKYKKTTNAFWPWFPKQS